MSRDKKLAIWIPVTIAIVLIITVLIYFCWPWNSEFFSNATKEFLIPALDTTFVPQGLTQLDDNRFIVGGYMSSGEASRFYVIDENGEVDKYFTLLLEGNDYKGHSGGITYSDGIVWVAEGNNGGYCYRLSLADIDNVESGGKVNIIDKFATSNGADCVWVNDGLLWVGEFYRAGNYETKEEHHIKTRSGETNPAIAFAYKIDLNTSIGIESLTPVKALSTRGLCQGVAMTNDGKFVISTSYSISDSNLYYYDNVLEESNHSEIEVNGVKVPLWFLDNDSLISQTNAPSMSEEVVIDDDKVYILFESNCQKYRLVNRKKLEYVYSLPLSYLEK